MAADRAREPGGQARGLGGRLARRLLGLSSDEALAALARVGLEPPALAARIEAMALAFVDGCFAALAEDADTLGPRLEQVDADLRSFAYEGAGTGLAALDAVLPWPAHRLRHFLAGPAASHAYIVHIGAGWAMARLPRLAAATAHRLDPLLKWLAYDGAGFHEGLFAAERTVARQEVPRWVTGYACRAFDRGIGRSLWFTGGADPGRIARHVAAFPPTRQGELWSGVGLACAYAGGRDEATVAELARLAAAAVPCLAQGVAHAAHSRVRAGERAPQTALACRVVWGLDLEAAAALVTTAGRDLPPEESRLPQFEVWRRRVQERFSQREGPLST